MIVEAGPISCILAESTESHFFGTNSTVPGAGHISIRKTDSLKNGELGEKCCSDLCWIPKPKNTGRCL